VTGWNDLSVMNLVAMVKTLRIDWILWGSLQAALGKLQPCNFFWNSCWWKRQKNSSMPQISDCKWKRFGCILIHHVNTVHSDFFKDFYYSMECDSVVSCTLVRASGGLRFGRPCEKNLGDSFLCEARKNLPVAFMRKCDRDSFVRISILTGTGTILVLVVVTY